MFEALFKNVEEEDPDKPTTLAEDVDWILGNTNFVLLRAAWDECLHILRNDYKYDEDESKFNLEGKAIDSWYALNKAKELDYDLSKFDIFELHMLKALKDGYEIYDEILHTLIDHHSDSKEGKYLFESHPEIHKHIPEEYDNVGQVLEVLAEVIKLYRWELERFSTKRSEEVDQAIEAIVQAYVKKK